MILPQDQTNRFYKLFDLLATYAHRRLQVVSDEEFFVPSGPRGISLWAQNKTMNELWLNRDVIRDYVGDNPDKLPQKDLRVIESWTSAYYSDFYVVHKPSTTKITYFLSHDRAFEVWGIVKELDEVVGTFPARVIAALIPFEDHIIVALALEKAEWRMRRKEKRAARTMLEQALAAGNLVTTGQQLVEIGEQEEGLVAKLQGTIKDNNARIAKLTAKIMDEYCTPGSITTSLDELLKRDSADYRKSAAWRKQFIERSTNPELLQFDVGCMKQYELELFERAVNANGHLHISLDELTRMDKITPPPLGLLHYFHEDDGYVAIVPRETLNTARQLDWEKASADSLRHLMLVRFFNAIVGLRGIVAYSKAIEEYLALFPSDTRDSSTVEAELTYAIAGDESNVCVLETPDERYMVHWELLSEWRVEMHKDGKRGSRSYDQGDPGKLVSAYLRKHQKNEPRAVQLSMLSPGSLDDWKYQLPASLAMRDFLETHAPKDANPYAFAENVLVELFAEAAWGTPEESSNRLFDILEYHGYPLFDNRQNDQVLMDLWLKLYNSLPNWANNGWSNSDKDHRRPGKRTFFNEDGSVMRVGRNDPCPCGSGKKYKRCCGRA